MKKVKIIAIIVIYVGLIFSNTQVFAASKGKTINETTRLREKASTSSSTVTLISINQEVEIILEEDEWYKVKYTSNGKTYSGYIRNDMLKTDSKETTEKENTEKAEESTESEKTVENTSKTVEIKEGTTGVLSSKIEVNILPLINSSKIGNIEKETKVTISETLGIWTYIESDNQSGWVITEKLEKSFTNKKSEEKAEKEEVKKEEATKKESKTEREKEEQKMYVSSQTVNLRKKSNSSSTILKQLSRNTQVTVVEKINNTWSKVKVDGITGYISSAYLSEKKVKVTSRGSETSREDKKEDVKEENKKEEPKKETTQKEPTKKEETKKETAKKEEAKKEDNKQTESTKTTGADIVKLAKKYLGYKYVLGQESPSKGFDCSGLVYYVYGKKGYSLNRTSSTQVSNGKKVSKSNLKQGDLVFFNNGGKTRINHVGIYIGGGNFIHAANPRKGVIITALSNSYYAKRYVTARRIIN